MQEKTDTTILPRVIAISSGKGGVGKTSIAVNLGISLAKGGARVCLLDADTGLANANILLGLTPQFSIEHVLYGAKAIEEVMLDGPHGMKIVPGANGIGECVTLHPRQQLRLTRELARVETDFDFILIDTAAGINDTTLDFISSAHHTLVVLTPEPTSLTDAFSLIKLLKRRRSTIQYHAVVNMCSSTSQAKEVYHRFCAAVEKYIGIQCHYLGHLLRDESMRAAVMLQNPVAMFPDTDPSCRSFVKLADNLDVAASRVSVSGAFSAYWHRLYREQRGDKKTLAKARSRQPIPTDSSAETRDNDYLSELRSRMLLLIEQGHADQQSLQKLLQESVEAFTKRYSEAPVNSLRLVEQLVQSPERDDQLLRDIADRVKPWSALSNTPPTAELAGSIDIVPVPGSESSVEPSSAQSSESDSPSESAPEPKLKPEPKAPEPEAELKAKPCRETSPEIAAAVVHSNPATAAIHHYDAARFGSQEHLLDMLQRQANSERSVAELLDTLI